MSYEILDDITSADVAMRITGKSLRDIFIAGAEALMSVMLQNPQDISRDLNIDLLLENESVELLFHGFLQELIFFKDSESLLLLPESADIEETKKGYRLSCRTSGEKIDRNKHHFNTDVKAMTMHNFQMAREKDTWVTVVVFDV